MTEQDKPVIKVKVRSTLTFSEIRREITPQRRERIDAINAEMAEQTHDELHEAIHNTCTKPIHEGER